jgi:hypothetical protein
MDPHPDLTRSVLFGLGWIWLILFGMNAWWTYHSVRSHRDVRMPDVLGGQHVPTSAFWAMYSALLLMIALGHFATGSGTGDPAKFAIRLPVVFKNIVDRLLADPRSFFALSIGLFVVLIWARRWLVRPTVAWVLLNISLVFMALSLTDYDFRQIVGKPDNVPIVAMLFIVGYFTWLYFRRAVDNDDRIAQGRPLFEQEDNEKILVWPDLVYTELICMVVLTAILVVWGIGLQAPLEEPASAAKTPNPSKAPWYFLGLQEMLVYYDPWLAGVVFPSLILVGLMAIPYIDFNKQGNGYYTFKERAFAVTVFLFGFLPLWVAMIILGTFIRGPNWNMFGIYEYWDVHKLELLNNVNLSDIVWVNWMGEPLPRPASDAGAFETMVTILKREWLGLLIVISYLAVLPPLGAIVFRGMFIRMGFLRYMVLANLMLFMWALPLKMAARWAFNLKYIVAIPEWFFNI